MTVDELYQIIKELRKEDRQDFQEIASKLDDLVRSIKGSNGNPGVLMRLDRVERVLRAMFWVGGILFVGSVGFGFKALYEWVVTNGGVL